MWTTDGWDPRNIPNGDDKDQIRVGPAIKCHTIWTRANDGNSEVKDIQYGIPT